MVVTQPDRPAGRGQKLKPTPVKAAAREAGIAVVEPDRLRDPGVLATLTATGADLFTVASYGKIVPASLLAVPRRGALNVHPSLLPLYRGATPLQAQLRDAVSSGGVTIIRMDAGMDTGDIVLQERSAIGPRETYGELHDRLARLGAALLERAVALVLSDDAPYVPQGETGVPEAEVARTTTRPLGKDDLTIDWRWPAARIVDHVRSLSPVPGARARLDGEADAVKILEARAVAERDPEDLVVPCGDGTYVAIERLVPPNRKPTTGRAYRASARANAGRSA